MIAILAITALPSPASAGWKAPQWTAGDYWEYNITGRGTSSLLQVQGQQGLAVNGSTYQVYNVTVVSNNSLSGIRVFYAWYLVLDIASVGGYGAGSGPVTSWVLNPPRADVPFPLEVGASTSWSGAITWFSSGQASHTDYGGTGVVFTKRVARRESVTVPAGTFQTYVIETSWNRTVTSTAWYSPQVGNVVQVESPGGYEAPMELQGYHLERPAAETLFGIDLLLWVILVVTLIVVAVAAVALRRHRRRLTPVITAVGSPPKVPTNLPPSLHPPK